MNENLLLGVLLVTMAGLGTGIIHFSGGEPTLRPDLPQLVKRAKEKNIIVSMTTNGSASAETMGRLLDIDIIRVSIDGPERIHDSLRQSPGAFKKAIQTLEFLASKNKKPIITALYTEQSSYAMLEELAVIARSLNIQVSLTMLDRYVNLEDLDAGHKDRRSYLDSELFRGFVSTTRELRKRHGDTVVNPEPFWSTVLAGGLEKTGCRAMDIAICLKSDGSVSLPCNSLSLKRLKGNIRESYYGKEAEGVHNLQGRHPLCRECVVRCMTSATALLKLKGLVSVFDSYIRSLR